MSIKLTSAETGRNRSSLAAAVGTSDKIDIASFSSTYIKNTPAGWPNVSVGAIDTTYASSIAAAVQINNIYVTDSSFNILDDTAISTSGGYLKIIGVGFQSGCVVYIQGVVASSVSFVNSTELRVTTPALSSGTLQVYVVNPNNSVAIRLSGIVASGVPDWQSTSPLTSQLSDTAFSIQLTATSDSTIAYSLQNGSSLPSGTSLSSSGLFSGTVSGISTETTYSFTIVATDLELQDTAKVFSVTVTTGDVYFYLTSLLLNAEANTWLSDASSNNTQILTIGNDTKSSAFSPYNTNWSAYFDGSGDYLSVANTTPAAFGTGPYTIEFWYWGDGTSQNYQPVFIGSGGLSAFVGYENNVSIWVAGNPLIRQVALVKNAWNFVQFIRTSTSTNGLSMTVNGTTWYGTDSNNWGSQSFTVGYDSTPRYVTGYLADFRISNTARSISTPTSRFTADSNTKFLTCQSNRHIDSSTANSGIGFGIAVSGEVANKTFSPFQDTDSTTGSAYFDGTGDYLVYPDSANMELGSGDFCVECWIYPTTVGSTGVIIDKRVSSYGPLLLWRSGSTLVVYMSSNGSSWDMVNGSIISNPIPGGGLVVNNWYHIAIYRVSGVIYAAVNGIVSVLNASNTSTPNNNAGNWFIGTETNGSTNPYTGYISNLRFVVGSGIYSSSNFTPPTTTLTAVTNTRLLSLQYRKGENNSRFIEQTTSKSLVTRYGNLTQGSYSPFSPAGWSGYFDGSGDYLTVPSNAAFAFGTSPYTVEAWVYMSVLNGNADVIFDAGSTTGSFGLNILGLGDARTVYVNTYGTGQLSTLITTTAVPYNTWTHIAVCRNSTSSNDTRIYINGVLSATGTDATNWTVNTTPSIGYNGAGSTYYFGGYLSNVRVVKGTALYSGNTFTVPTQSLTAVANTVLLTCQDNYFKDNSTANNGSGFTVTRIGDTKTLPFNPFRGSGAYTPSIHGGSAYFDGNGDYLTITNSPQLLLSGDHSIEFWMYPDGPQNRYSCPWFYTSSGTYYFSNPSDSGGSMSLLIGPYSGSAWPLQITIPATEYTQSLNNWSHIVVTRSGTASRVFINGVLKGYATSAQSIGAQTSTFNIGYSGSDPTTYFKGWMSNFRIVNGSIPTTYQTANTTVGTKIFNSLTTVPSYVANTVLQVDFTNGAIVDATTRNNFETIADTKSSNRRSKYSNNSIYFDGTGDYLTAVNNPNYNFPGDFTIEFWMYCTDASGIRGLISKGNGTNGWGVYFNATGDLRLIFQYGGSITYGTGTVVVGAWSHVAITRSGTTGNNLKFFVDGVLVTESSSLGGYDTSSTVPLVIGGSMGASYVFAGYMEDVRLTKGIARYTTSSSIGTQVFTPPTRSFLTR